MMTLSVQLVHLTTNRSTSLQCPSFIAARDLPLFFEQPFPQPFLSVLLVAFKILPLFQPLSPLLVFSIPHRKYASNKVMLQGIMGVTKIHEIFPKCHFTQVVDQGRSIFGQVLQSVPLDFRGIDAQIIWLIHSYEHF